MKHLCTSEEASEIVEQYADLVYKFALSLTKQKDVADDVFQEVFLRYAKRKPSFESEDHARAWFFTVTKNCCRTHFTSAFMRHTAPLEEDIPMLQKEEHALYFYVLKLPAAYRSVIHLFYYEGLSTLQIAAILHKKDATIRTQLKRARERLKVLLEGCDIDEIL